MLGICSWEGGVCLSRCCLSLNRALGASVFPPLSSPFHPRLPATHPYSRQSQPQSIQLGHICGAQSIDDQVASSLDVLLALGNEEQPTRRSRAVTDSSLRTGARTTHRTNHSQLNSRYHRDSAQSLIPFNRPARFSRSSIQFNTHLPIRTCFTTSQRCRCSILYKKQEPVELSQRCPTCLTVASGVLLRESLALLA